MLDFRSLIARKLGLDSKTLSIPDYEITAHLERLLTAVQPTVAIPVVPIPTSTTSINPTHQEQTSYQSQYHHNERIPSTHTRHRSPSPVPHRSEISHRARSLSPLHVGIDPKTY